MQAEDVAVAEISPDGNLMFEFLLGFLIFILILTLDLLANNFDGSNDAVSCPRVERVNFLDNAKTTTIHCPTDDVFVIQSDRLALVIRLGLNLSRFRGSIAVIP